MSRRAMTVGALLLLAVTGTATAQDVDTAPTLIQFKLQEVDGQKTLRVGPRAAGLCKKAHTEKCPDSFRLRWLGAKKYGADKLRIQFDDAAAAKACFGSDVIELKDAKGSKTTVVKVDASCNLSGSKKALFFTVTCLDAAGNACSGVAAVDPGVIIESGGP